MAEEGSRRRLRCGGQEGFQGLRSIPTGLLELSNGEAGQLPEAESKPQPNIGKEVNSATSWRAWMRTVAPAQHPHFKSVGREQRVQLQGALTPGPQELSANTRALSYTSEFAAICHGRQRKHKDDHGSPASLLLRDI